MELSPSQLRWIRLTRLWHVGTMNPADKGKNSQEGNGLSVSRHPRDWSAIARLGGALYTLTCNTGRLLDFHALTAPQRAALDAWGLERGLLEQRELWQLSWTDTEDEDTRFTLFSDHAKACAEAEFMRDEETPDVKLEPTLRAVLTEASYSRLGFTLDPLLSQDIVSTFWVEDCTDADGVWWADRHDPDALSAPRGVINLRQLARWCVSGPAPLR